MEAFILADRVLAKTHMEPNSQVQLKYLKKYDLPPPISSPHPTSNTVKSPSVMNRSPPQRSQPLNMNKTKHLLSSLFDPNITAPIQPLRKNNVAVRKYFTLASDFSGSGHVKKGRNMLLVKKVEPQAQQYDTNIGFVTRRTPSWGFNPVHRMKIQRQEPKNRVKTAGEKGRAEISRGKTRQGRSEGEELALERFQKRIYQEMCQRSGIGELLQGEPWLQYSSQELSRCTAEIFKKYQLDQDSYFKKFISDLA